jgi:integral membrane protein
MDKLAYKKQLGIFAKISFFEGVSFVVLLAIAMPLKYAMGMPLAVKYIGWAHGALFVAYGFQLLYVGITFQWKFSRILLYGLCSILPLAPFWVEKQVKNEIETI